MDYKNKSQTHLRNTFIFLGVLVFLASLTFALGVIEVSTPEGTTSNRSIEIEYNITSDNLNLTVFNWNGVNTTIYNTSSLILMHNFNNLSALDENDTHVFDISGHGNNGTAKNRTAAICGAFGACPQWNDTDSIGGNYEGYFEFDGSDKIDTDMSTNFNTTSWTIEVWAKLRTAKSSCSNGNNIISKSFDYRIFVTPSCRLNFITRDQSGSDQSISSKSSQDLSDGLWHQLIYTYNFSSNVSTVYFDGEFADNITQEGIFSTLSNFIIGGEADSFFWNGSIDEVSIWNRTFSEDEVSQMYYSNIKKFNLTDWVLYINESVPSLTQTNTYFSCATNSTGSENCTDTKTIITGWIVNVSVNFAEPIGQIAERFYGANTHVDMQPNRLVDTNDDGTLDTQIDYEWQRTTWLDSNMDNQRGDMYLSSFYDGQGNRGFEHWRNTTTCQVIAGSGCDNYAHDWEIGHAGSGHGNISRNTEAHSGAYSMNVSTTSGTLFPFVDVLFEAGSTYNISVWIKSSDVVSIGLQDLSDFTFCDSATSSGGGAWEQISSTCTITTNQSFRIPTQLGAGAEALIDDWHLTKDGANYSWWMIAGKNLTGQKDLVEWANNNNQKILYITIGIPRFLQNVTDGNCFNSTDNTFSGSCIPDYDFNDWFEILNDFISQVTNEGEWIDSIEIEVHNEPYLSNWLGFAPTDNMTKAVQYVEHYNQTYEYLKTKYPTIQVGGPSGNMVSGELMVRTFLSNMTTRMDFCSIHPYESSGVRYSSTDLMITRIDQLIANATDVGANCSRIIVSEWNNVDSTLKNTTSSEDEFAVEFAYVYQSVLNKYPENVTFQMYQWNEQYRYSNTAKYPEYPQRWTMVTEPQLVVATDPSFKPPYNITRNFATYHSTGSTVYNSTNNDSEDNIESVASRFTNGHYVTIINKDTEPRNITLSLINYPYTTIKNLETEEVFPVTGGQAPLGIIDRFGIVYLGGENPTNVVLLELNENQGTTAYDVSGNGNNGTITGAIWDDDEIGISLTENIDYNITGATFYVADQDLAWTQIRLNYDYFVDTSAKGAAKAMINNFTTYPALIGLIGTIILLGLVITILITSFLKRDKRTV